MINLHQQKFFKAIQQHSSSNYADNLHQQKFFKAIQLYTRTRSRNAIYTSRNSLRLFNNPKETKLLQYLHQQKFFKAIQRINRALFFNLIYTSRNSLRLFNYLARQFEKFIYTSRNSLRLFNHTIYENRDEHLHQQKFFKAIQQFSKKYV